MSGCVRSIGQYLDGTTATPSHKSTAPSPQAHSASCPIPARMALTFADKFAYRQWTVKRVLVTLIFLLAFLGLVAFALIRLKPKWWNNMLEICKARPSPSRSGRRPSRSSAPTDRRPGRSLLGGSSSASASDSLGRGGSKSRHQRVAPKRRHPRRRSSSR